jgi:hypothetical protein
MDVERVVSGGQILALIIRRAYSKPGISFFTPDEFSQQLGFMQHAAGTRIQPHIHQAVRRELKYTQEVLFLRKGKLRVDFYNESQAYIASRILDAGDVILLASAGHGFEVLEDVEMFEVKQGPYAEGADKVRFRSVADNDVVLDGGGQ